MMDFIKNNLILIIYILTAIIYILISIFNVFKNKKIKNFKDLIEFITFAINDAEDLCLTGNQKFFYVMREIESLCKQLCIEFDTNYFSDLIENILSTPQKKDKNGGY